MTIKGLKRNGVRNRATSNVCLTDRSLSLQFSVVDVKCSPSQSTLSMDFAKEPRSWRNGWIGLITHGSRKSCDNVNCQLLHPPLLPAPSTYNSPIRQPAPCRRPSHPSKQPLPLTTSTARPTDTPAEHESQAPASSQAALPGSASEPNPLKPSTRKRPRAENEPNHPGTSTAVAGWAPTPNLDQASTSEMHTTSQTRTGHPNQDIPGLSFPATPSTNLLVTQSRPACYACSSPP